MNIDEQQEDHRRRKAERAEQERLARERRENPTHSELARERREEIIRRRQEGTQPRPLVECHVCRERGERSVGLHPPGKACSICFNRHRTALFDTGRPDTSEPEIVENYFPPEKRFEGI